MMTNSSGGQTRPVLADVTNRPGKRKFSNVSGDSAIKSGGEKEGNQIPVKIVHLESENLTTEKCKFTYQESPSKKCNQTCSKPISCHGADSLSGNVVSIAPNTTSLESKELSDTNLADDDVSRSSAVCIALMPVTSVPCNVSAIQSDIVRGPIPVDDGENIYKDMSAGNFSSSQCGFVGSSKLANSFGTKSFELERCTGLKSGHSSSLSMAVNSLKSCSCSFCLKAAYIWSDLHYQDIKGRIAAINKSQKEAINLVQRSARGKEALTHVHGSSSRSSKLESDLMNQWRSLFLHMEDVFVREGSQLKDSFLTMKDLREKCKTNLEMINAKPSDDI